MFAHFVSYPLFRLTLALCVGILLADFFLPDASGLPWLAGVLGGCVVLAAVCFRPLRYRFRGLFGGVVYVAFALFGAVLLLISREDARFGWSLQEAFYTGTITDVPHRKSKTMQAVVKVEWVKECAADEWKPVGREILLYWMPDSVQGSLACGDRICFRTRISRPFSDRDFSGFDYGLYLERQGIAGTGIAFSGCWQKLSEARPLSFRQKALLFREDILEKYRSWGLEGDVFAVVSALTVGDKSELTRELKDTYSAAGTSHILALSGLHVMILAMMLSWVCYPLRFLRGGKWLTGGLVVLVLWGFAFLSGLSPSVIRAVVMYSLYVLASVFSESRFSGTSSVSLAAFLMLVCQPLYLFDISFQLSFVAVLSILLVYPILERLVHFRWGICTYLWRCLALSASAQLGTLPFILYYFGTFPTYFLLANLVVTPLSVCILGFSFAALVSGLPILVKGLALSVEMLNSIMEWVRHLSGSQITSVYFTSFQAWICGVFLCLLVAYGAKRSARNLIAMCCLLNVLAASFLYESMQPVDNYLYFTRSGIYTKRERRVSQLVSASNLYVVRGHRIALANDGRWKDKRSNEPSLLDYVYICRGFRGTVRGLSKVFRMKQVILDGSLGEVYRESLKRECESLGLPCVDISEKGSYSVGI